MSSRNPQFFFDFQRKSAVNFVHIAILPGNPFCRLAISTELRYNSIGNSAQNPSVGFVRFCRYRQDSAVTQEREATNMRQEPSSENCRLVYLTRRAYETGEIRLLLRTDNVCAEKTPAGSCSRAARPGWSCPIPETACWSLWHVRWRSSRSLRRF